MNAQDQSSNCLPVYMTRYVIKGALEINGEGWKKKMKVNYRIQAGRPYTIQHIAYDIDDMIISDFCFMLSLLNNRIIISQGSDECKRLMIE